MQRPSVSLDEFPRKIVSVVLQDNATDNAAGVAEKKAPLSVTVCLSDFFCNPPCLCVCLRDYIECL